MAIDTGYAGFGGALFAIIGIWSVVGLGIYVWYLWALARLFPYLGLPAGHGWIPVWNQWRLIERGGLPGWLSILMLIPGLSLVALVVSIIAIHHINEEQGEGTGMTVLGAFVPPLWATLLGSRLRDRGYASGPVPGSGYDSGRGTQRQGLVEYGPDGQVYPLLTGAAPAPANGHFVMPPVSPSFDSTGMQVPGMQQPPQAPPRQPERSAQPLPPAATPIVPTENPWGLGNTTEGNFQRLANEAAPSREASFGASLDARPFSWPEPAPYAPEAPLLPTPQYASQAPSPSQPAPDPAWTPSAEAVRASAAQEDADGLSEAVALPEVVAETRVTTTEQAPVVPPVAPLVFQQPTATPSESVLEVPQRTVAGAESGPAPVPLVLPQAPSHLPEAVASAPGHSVASVSPAEVVPPAAQEEAAPQYSAISEEEPQAQPIAPRTEPGEEESGLLDDELDRTIVVSRRPHWVLELPDGQELDLDTDDIVVGRKPSAIAGSGVLVIPDATRTLSKAHARFRLVDGVWTVEDLQSTNGVFNVEPGGLEVELTPGSPVAACEQLILGTLAVRLRLSE